MATLVINDEKVDSMKSIVKEEDDLDARLRALKPVNKKKGKKLKKAFESLNKELKNLGSFDYKQAKDEYMTNKYGL